ncbi:MAG: ATP-binding protein [bacterium]
MFAQLKEVLAKRIVYLKIIIFLGLLLLLMINAGSWFFYNRTRNYLEDELAKRLIAIAATTALKIDPIGLSEESNKARLKKFLKDVRQTNNLFNISILDTRQQVVVEAKDRTEEEREKFISFTEEGTKAWLRAWGGTNAVSGVYWIDGTYLKSGYVPIRDEKSIPRAILSVEASVRFFNVLNLYKRSLILSGLISLAFTFLFGLFLYRVMVSTTSAQESVRQAEKLATMGQLSAGLAHEIRNALGVIDGTAEVLKQRYNLPQGRDEMFDYIPAEVKKLKKITSEFLTFFKGTPLKLEPGNINSVIDHTFISLRSELENVHIKLSRRFRPDLPLTLFDSGRMEQVFLNLLLNAKEAMPDGGEISVTTNVVTAKAGQSYIQIKVSDSGQGIPPQTVDKLFEPFFTTKEEGHGLGLSIVSRIIEEHKGEITVESEKGVGTTFAVFLPVRSKVNYENSRSR